MIFPTWFARLFRRWLIVRVGPHWATFGSLTPEARLRLLLVKYEAKALTRWVRQVKYQAKALTCLAHQWRMKTW